jgi:hypothetical protein
LNPVVKAQVKDFVTTNAITSISESEQFEIYSIYAVLNGALGESVEPLDVHLAGSEFGVDGVAILVQGRLITNTAEAEEAILEIRSPEIDFYFFQSKTGTSFDYGNISKFFDALTGFFNGEMQGESAQLDDLIAVKDLLWVVRIQAFTPIMCVLVITTSRLALRGSFRLRLPN